MSDRLEYRGATVLLEPGTLDRPAGYYVTLAGDMYENGPLTWEQIVDLVDDALSTVPTLLIEPLDLERADVIVHEGRRVRVREIADYGDHVEIRGIEIANRHKFTLRTSSLVRVER